MTEIDPLALLAGCALDPSKTLHPGAGPGNCMYSSYKRTFMIIYTPIGFRVKMYSCILYRETQH